MTTNCPVCGRHMTPMDNHENRITLNDMDLPICKTCADKKQQLVKQLENLTPEGIAKLRNDETRVFIDSILDENPQLVHKNPPKISGNIVGFAFVQGRKNPTTNGEK